MGKAICMQCEGFMESKHRHDFAKCPCGASFLDGGDSYFRAGGYASAAPDYVMTAEEFWEWLDQLDKQMEEEDSEQKK